MGRVVVDGVREFARDWRVRRVVFVVEVLVERCLVLDDAVDARDFTAASLQSAAPQSRVQH